MHAESTDNRSIARTLCQSATGVRGSLHEMTYQSQERSNSCVNFMDTHFHVL